MNKRLIEIKLAVDQYNEMPKSYYTEIKLLRAAFKEIPYLLDEIERLRAALEIYASIDKWDVAEHKGVVFGEFYSPDPWKLAQDALKGDE